MSTYGPPGNVPPGGPGGESDPWSDKTVAYGQPAQPVQPVPSVPPVQSAPPAAPAYQPGAAVPPPPAPAGYDQGGYPQQGYAQPGYPQQGYQQPAYQAQGGYDQGGYQPAGYQPQGNYQAPEYGQPYGEQWQAPPKQRSTAVIVLSVLLALVVLGGIGIGIYFYTRNSSSGTQTAPPPPADAGQCVVSDGQPLPKTMMKKVECGPNTLLVLKVLRGTTDTSQCTNVSGSTTYYSFAWPDASSDYVLCMQQQ